MKRLIAPLLLVLLLAGGVAAEEKVGPIQIKRGNFPLITVDGAETYYAYYGDDNALYIVRKSDGKAATITKKGYVGNHVWLGFTKDEILVLWRAKESETGFKFVYLQRASKADMDFSASKEVVVNRARDALLPMNAIIDGEKIFVVWSDERVDNLPVYLNYSLDGGKTFQKEDIDMTPGYSASLSEIVKSGDRYYFFFHGKTSDEANTSIYVRESADGAEWSEIIKIHALDEWAPYTIDAYATKAGPVAFWGGVKGLYYGFAGPDGQWQSKVVGGTKGMDINRFTVKTDPDGNMMIATSYMEWLARKVKSNVFIFRSSDQGRTWGSPLKINMNTYNNTNSYFNDMHITDDGRIFVVWQDHRLIRGNIYLNYSLDGGATWLTEDINIEGEPGMHNSFYPYIQGAGGTVYAVWMQYVDDSLRGPKDLMLKEIVIK